MSQHLIRRLWGPRDRLFGIEISILNEWLFKSEIEYDFVIWLFGYPSINPLISTSSSPSWSETYPETEMEISFLWKYVSLIVSEIIITG